MDKSSKASLSNSCIKLIDVLKHYATLILAILFSVIISAPLILAFSQSAHDIEELMQLQVSEIRIYEYDKNDISDFHFGKHPLSAIQEGMEIVINGLVINQNHVGEHFDYVTQITDGEGYAQYIHVRYGVAVPLGGQIGIDSQISPIILDKSGNYTIKIFTWRSIDSSPVALSDGAIKSITIIPSSSSIDGFAWMAMNTTQCDNPWDRKFRQEHGNNPSVAEELVRDREQPVVHWYFAKRGIEILDIESVSYLPDGVGVCQACHCTSGDTLFVKVSSGKTEEMKDVGFVQKEPPFEA